MANLNTCGYYHMCHCATVPRAEACMRPSKKRSLCFGHFSFSQGLQINAFRKSFASFVRWYDMCVVNEFWSTLSINNFCLKTSSHLLSGMASVYSDRPHLPTASMTNIPLPVKMTKIFMEILKALTGYHNRTLGLTQDNWWWWLWWQIRNLFYANYKINTTLIKNNKL